MFYFSLGAIMTSLVLIMVFLIGWSNRSSAQHKELMSLLNDLATMVGEWLEEQER